MAKNRPFFTEAVFRLRRENTKDTWVLRWPNDIQDSAFFALTHDEIMRFPGLREFLNNRLGVVDVLVTISTIDKERNK